MEKVVKLFLILVCLVSSSFAHAEFVKEVIIKGNKRVDVSTIKSLLTFTAGGEVDKGDINESLKKIDQTGMFSEVDLNLNNGVLTIKVHENARINKIVLEGNKSIKDKEIEVELSLKERGFFSKTKAYADAAKIRELYQAAGRYLVNVEPKVVKLDGDKVDVIFEIQEGKKSKIRKILFVGNKEVTSKTLRAQIASAETRWYKFLSSNDIFNQDRIEYDRELIVKYYQSKGYAAAQVVSAISNFSPDEDGFTITFTIDEGKKYYLNKIELDSAVRGLVVEPIMAVIELKPGEIYNGESIENTIDILTAKVNELGFAFVDVEVNKKLYDDKVDVIYTIKEGMKIYLNKINISGNLRTSDIVIRRQFKINEGDPFSQFKITKSEQGVNELRYFKKVTVTRVPVEEGEAYKQVNKTSRVDLDVKVEEDSTTGLTFGGGFDNHSGVIGQIGFNETNLFGNGQYLDIGFTTSKRNFQGNLSFTEPYFMGRDLAVGFDLFNEQSFKDAKAHRPFSRVSRGFGLRAGYGITEYLRHTVRYTFVTNKVKDISKFASDMVLRQKKNRVVSAVGQGLGYDRTDSSVDPRDGYYVSVDQEVAGVGGNTKFQKYQVSGRYYIPSFSDTTLIFALDSGIIRAFGGQKVSVADTFSLGGESLRGFDYNGVGPRAKKTASGSILGVSSGDALGGKNYYTVKAELKIPLNFQEEFGLYAKVFVDTGSNWGVDLLSGESKSDIYDSTKIRAAAGVGLGFSSPLGPISIYYAKPIRKEKFDEVRAFGILFTSKI
jgi:outer membrane protein insertion porin family